jgi:hypothetical protein
MIPIITDPDDTEDPNTAANLSVGLITFTIVSFLFITGVIAGHIHQYNLTHHFYR